MRKRQKDSWDKAFEELTFTDDYIFKLVMEQPEIFKAVLRLILPKIEVQELTSLETEKPFTVDYFFHGARFDILAKGGEKLIDMEIQVLDTGELDERAMYYLSLLVARSLKKGESYRFLGESYVVFFCKFDPFKLGLPMYSFSMTCDEKPALHLTKNARIIFFNAAAWDKCKNAQLAALLHYMMTGEAAGDLVHKIDQAVQEIKQDRKTQGGWGMFYEKLVAERAIGRDEGIREKALETARRALERGFAPDVIAELTGLALDEVEALL